MGKLFEKMLQRADPAHLKRTKPYLQYMMITLDLACSELLFTACDQDELDRHLDTGMSGPFLQKLLSIAQGLEAQVLARTAGLMEIYGKPPDIWESDESWGPMMTGASQDAD
jgi:hypothetical protein